MIEADNIAPACIIKMNKIKKAVIEAALETLQSKYQEPIQIEVEPLKNYVEAERVSSRLSKEKSEWLLPY